LIGGVFYVLMRKSMRDTPPLRLDNAIRVGSPDFEKYKKLIPLDEQEADESPRALGDIVMTLHATARNFTGRTIIGLEVRGRGRRSPEPAGQRTDGRRSSQLRRGELEPNKTMFVGVRLEGMTETDDRANIKMEVTGFSV